MVSHLLCRVVSMQETVSGSLLFLVQEQVTFSTFPQLQTWLVLDSGCSALMKLVLRLEGVIQEVQSFNHL